MSVLNEACQLTAVLIRLSKNDKVIPKRLFFICGIPLIDKARELYADLMLANDLHLNNDNEAAERLHLQNKAHKELIELNCLINTNLTIFSEKTLKPYSQAFQHMSHIRRLIDAWKNSDRKQQLNYKHQTTEIEGELLEELHTPSDEKLEPISSLKEAVKSLEAAGLVFPESAKEHLQQEIELEEMKSHVGSTTFLDSL